MSAIIDGANGVTAANLVVTGANAPANGIYLPTTNAVAIATNSTNALYIDANQNVGIGTTSPTYKFNVKNTSATSTTQAANTLALLTSNASNADVNLFLSNGVDHSAVFGMYGAGNVYWNVDGIERMRIDSSGNLLVGTTNSNPIGGGVNGVSLSASVSRFNSNGSDTVDIGRYSTTGTLIGFWYASSSVGTISTNGTSTAYNTSSDYRLKTNVTPLTTAQSGPIIDALKPSQFTWTADNTTDVGFIAHEMQAVIPRAVTGEKDAVDAKGKPVYQQVVVSSPEIIAYLVAEIQSLRARLKAANIA